MTQTTLLTCPHCESERVMQMVCGAFGWMECRTCGEKWDEETYDQHDRKPRVDKPIPVRYTAAQEERTK